MVHDHAQLNVITAGNPDHPPVLLLHAGVADHRMWNAQLEALSAADRYAIAHDRRGFGDTRAPDVPFSHVADAVAVLDAMTQGPALLVGCSQGGRIAVDLALAHPQRVSQLLLIGPALSGWENSEPHAAHIQALFDAMDRADEAEDLDALNELEARAWLDGPTSEAPRVSGPARALFLDMNGRALRADELTQEQELPSAVERLSQLPPTRVVCGTLDFPHVQRRCADIARAVGTELLHVEGVAHLPPMEKPDAIDRLVLQG